MNAEASDSMAASVAEAREDSFSDIVTILDEWERQRLLLEWNTTAADFPRTRCIHELFAEQAEHRPMAVAVVIDDQHISYGALDSRANQLANYLRTLGVGPEVVVGVGIDRSTAMILAVLGILKAGGVYLP